MGVADGFPGNNWLGGTDGRVGYNTQIYEGINQVQVVVVAGHPLKHSAPQVVDGALPNGYESAIEVSGKASNGLVDSQRVASGTSFLTHSPGWMYQRPSRMK